MKALGYYISLPFVYLISMLPFPILYLFSDFMYVIVYYIVGYRKNVIRQNLKNSFPEKSQSELIKIEKQFYHYIVDFFLETLKCITISEKTLMQRISIENREILEDLYKKNKNTLVTMGHYGNHEFVNLALPFIIPHKPKAVYRPLTNEYFDALFYKFRTKFGGIMTSMVDAMREVSKIENRPFAFFLVNDQSPPPERSYWTTFLNQETAFFTGVERFARQFEMPVVYVCAERVARGKYNVKVELVTDKPNETTQGEILEIHARKLERDIVADPSVWFWSHKRWKFTRINGEIVENIYTK